MRATSIEDTAHLQAHVNKVLQWTTDNNIMFNEDKLQLLRYYVKIEELRLENRIKITQITRQSARLL